MQVITINNKQYYSSKDVKVCEQPNYYEGCGISNSRFLKKYDLEIVLEVPYF